MTTHAIIHAQTDPAGGIVQPAADCCSSAEQAACCEPVDKAACCGEPAPAGGPGCGCR
jgi:hypothetical protein